MLRILPYALLIATFLNATTTQAQCKVRNGGFESWTPDTTVTNCGDSLFYNVPDNWFPFQGFSVNFQCYKEFPVKKSPDAYSGSHSIKLELDTFMDVDSTDQSDAEIGNDLIHLQEGVELFAGDGFAYCGERKNELSGYYKTEGQAGIDTFGTAIAQVLTQTTINGNDTLYPIGTGFAALDSYTSNYQKFTANIDYSKGDSLGITQPDSINIILVTNADSSTLAQNGPFRIWFDDLSLSGNPTTVNESSEETGLTLHPNPFRDKLRIVVDGQAEQKASMVEIHDIRGSLIKRVRLTGRRKTLHLESLEEGMYFARFKGPNGKTFKNEKVVKIE